MTVYRKLVVTIKGDNTSEVCLQGQLGRNHRGGRYHTALPARGSRDGTIEGEDTANPNGEMIKAIPK